MELFALKYSIEMSEMEHLKYYCENADEKHCKQQPPEYLASGSLKIKILRAESLL